jgi:hypothetical protein
VDAIREAIDTAKIKSKAAAAAVCGHSVIVKKVSLPAMTREELDEQIRWEAEQYIPFDVNEVNLDFQILETSDGEGQMDVLLVAAKKDLIDDYVQVISEAGLTPAVIDVAAFAVENAFEANYEVRHPDGRHARVHPRYHDGGKPLHRRDPEDSLHQLRGSRAHQAGREEVGGQPGGSSAGGREGDAVGHGDGDRGDQPLAGLLLGDQRGQPHRASDAVGRKRQRGRPEGGLP